MAIIGGLFGVQTIGAASQPVFGTTLSANSTIAPDQFTGDTGPSSQPSISYLTLTSVVGFIPGYRIAVAPKNHFEQYVSWGFQDCGTILPGGTGNTIKVQGLTLQHLSGEYVLICEDASEVEIVPVVTTGPLYIGAYSTVGPADSGVFDVIPQLSGALTYWHQSREGTGGNTYRTSEYWIYGTAGSTFVARFAQT